MRYVIEFNRGRGDEEWHLSGNRLSTNDQILIQDTEFPSLEAAQREAAYHQNRSSYTYRARDTQEGAEMATGVARTEPTVAQARAVRIYRRNREWVIDAGGRSLPPMSNLYPYMTLSSRQSCRDRGDYTITDALLHGVSPQMLSSALAAWFTEHPNPSGNAAPLVQEEGVSELPNNSAYLALGDFIYKMVPVRQASSSKAVKLMREKARVEIERVREGLRQQASQEAQNILAQANQRAATIRVEAEAELRANANAPKFPAWAVGIPLKVGVQISNSGHLFAMKKTELVFTELVHGSRHWPMNPERKGVKVSFWLPLNGNPEHVHLEEGSKDLPHATTNSACLKIGERTGPVTSMAGLNTLSAQVARAFSVINLASLLRADMTCWNPEVTALLPAPIKKWLETYRTIHIQRDDPVAIAALPPTDILERQEETWSTL